MTDRSAARDIMQQPYSPTGMGNENDDDSKSLDLIASRCGLFSTKEHHKWTTEKVIPCDRIDVTKHLILKNTQN